MQSGFGMIRVFISDWPAFTFSNHKTVRSQEVVRVKKREKKTTGRFASGLFLRGFMNYKFAYIELFGPNMKFLSSESEDQDFFLESCTNFILRNILFTQR